MEKLIAKRKKELLRRESNVLRAAAVLALVMACIFATTLWSLS